MDEDSQDDRRRSGWVALGRVLGRKIFKSVTCGRGDDVLRKLEALDNQVARTAAVTWFDGNRWTALHAAAAVGNADACRRLLAAGANAKWKTAHGADVVTIACQAQQVRIVALLTAADLPPPPSLSSPKTLDDQQQHRQSNVQMIPLPPPLEVATTTTTTAKVADEGMMPTFESFVSNSPPTFESGVSVYQSDHSPPPTFDSGASIGGTERVFPNFEDCMASGDSTDVPPRTFESCTTRTDSQLPRFESKVSSPYDSHADDTATPPPPPPPPPPLSDERSGSQTGHFCGLNRGGENDSRSVSTAPGNSNTIHLERELTVATTVSQRNNNYRSRKPNSRLVNVEDSRMKNWEREEKSSAAKKRANDRLLRACAKRRPHLIESLLGQGAVATCSRLPDGFSPLHAILAPSLEKGRDDETLRLQCVHLLLNADKQTAAAVDFHGCSPLFYAVKSGSLILTEALLDAMPEMTIKSTKISGRTVLHVASAYGFTHLIAPLCRAGAKLDAVSLNGWTPLGEAARHGHLAVVRALLANGASVRREETALKVAIERRYYEVAVALLDARAPFGAKVADLARASSSAEVWTRVKRQIVEKKERALNAAEAERIRQADETRRKHSIAADS